MSGTVVDSVDDGSKDIVLEIDTQMKPMDMLAVSASSRTNLLHSMDNRRQRVLTDLQSMLRQKASDDPEPIITKDIFFQLFSDNVSFRGVFCIFFYNNLDLTIGSGPFILPTLGLSKRRQTGSNKPHRLIQRKTWVNS